MSTNQIRVFPTIDQSQVSTGIIVPALKEMRPLGVVRCYIGLAFNYSIIYMKYFDHSKSYRQIKPETKDRQDFEFKLFIC